jgi:hypothetical protein
MANGLAAVPLPAARETWLVRCGDDADRATRVRDYFRRLGLAAELAGPAEVEVDGEVTEAELAEYVESWRQVNRVALGWRRRTASEAPAPLREAPLMPPPRLGELLQRKGLIGDAQLAAGLAEAKEAGEMLGVVLLRLGLIFEEELARVLSEQLDIPYISVGRVGVEPSAAKLLPPEVGMTSAAIPVRYVGDAVQVVFADPTDPGAVDAVRRHLPRIELAVAELSDIRLAWRDLEQSSRGDTAPR